jgi:hypothetical protein
LPPLALLMLNYVLIAKVEVPLFSLITRM